MIPYRNDFSGISETDKAWTAGIIDGEGCVGLYHYRYPRRYAISVQVGNTDWRMIERLHYLWGSSGTPFEKPAKGKRRTSWQFKLSADAARRFLAAIRPYLVTKAEQADICLSFMEQSPPRIASRETLNRIRALNSRGYDRQG